MHHSDDELKNINPEMFDHFKQAAMKSDQAIQAALREKLGATGRYPEGKWQDSDEGEIQFAVGHQGKKVFIEFGKPVKWVGMNGNQAISFGNALTKHGRKANKGV